jgi:hypothetical protein
VHSAPLARSRRTLAALVVAALAPLGAAALNPSAGSRAATPPVSAFPVPGAHVASPRTQVTFRGVAPASIGAISVTGSQSGAHTGHLVGDSDGRGASFIPDARFRSGETVTVTTGLSIAGAPGGTFHFTVATPAGGVPGADPLAAARTRGDVGRFASRPDLIPATLKVTKRPSHTAAGDLFIAPQNGPYEQGPMIVGPYGGLIWFQPLPKGDSATDFRVQSYRGKPVLTWWQGRISHAGTGFGEDEIYDTSYRSVATVKGGNGISADLHEFQLTSQNTALITGYYAVYVNGASGRHTVRRLVLDSVVQEIDIPTGLVLYQWDSLDHVPVSSSYQPAPGNPNHPWDYFHLNSIQPQGDGNLVVSSRNDWAAYKISHQTGTIMWTLGGKRSTFKLGAGASFAFQHDVRLRPGNLVTLFDDGAGPPAVHKQSRAETLRLDYRRQTATVVDQGQHHPALLAFYEGNDQLLAGGDQLVGWGQQPYLTEFNRRGQTVFDARFVGPNSSYRAYRFAWTGTPATPPAIAARLHHGHTTVYASWNGSTQLSRWRVLAGSKPTALKAIATAGRPRFEATIALRSREPYVAAQALDARGHLLATSHTIRVG